MTALQIERNVRHENDDSLIEILAGCRSNDADSQEKLYKQFYGYALAVAFKYCSTKEDAVEAVNDSFIKVFDKIDTFDFSRPFKPWLRKIVINTSIDKIRAMSKYNNQTGLKDYHQNVNGNAESELTVKQIYRLINRLPVLHKFVFNLYEIEGYSHSEIAEMLNIRESSSRTYLTRAKATLRKLYNQLFFDGHE